MTWIKKVLCEEMEGTIVANRTVRDFKDWILGATRMTAAEFQGRSERHYGLWRKVNDFSMSKRTITGSREYLDADAAVQVPDELWQEWEAEFRTVHTESYGQVSKTQARTLRLAA